MLWTRDGSQLRTGRLFGQRKGSGFSEVDLLNEANFHRRHLSEWVGRKAVERYREDDDDEEVEPSMHFVRERSDGQNEEGA